MLFRRISHSAVRYAAAILLTAGITWGITARFGQSPSGDAPYTVSAPWGQRAEVKLGDGTQVWLNAGSTLSCSAGFATGQREVHISGEAFFEVARDKHRPFIVSTGDMKIKVLGTKFNVSAYEPAAATISLVEGAVEVTAGSSAEGSVNMKPEDQVHYADGELRLSHAMGSTTMTCCGAKASCCCSCWASVNPHNRGLFRQKCVSLSAGPFPE